MRKVKAVSNYNTWKRLQDIIIARKDIYIAVDDLRYLWGCNSSDLNCGTLIMTDENIERFLEWYISPEYIYDED